MNLLTTEDEKMSATLTVTNPDGSVQAKEDLYAGVFMNRYFDRRAESMTDPNKPRFLLNEAVWGSGFMKHETTPEEKWYVDWSKINKATTNFSDFTTKNVYKKPVLNLVGDVLTISCTLSPSDQPPSFQCTCIGISDGTVTKAGDLLLLLAFQPLRVTATRTYTIEIRIKVDTPLYANGLPNADKEEDSAIMKRYYEKRTRSMIDPSYRRFQLAKSKFGYGFLTQKGDKWVVDPLTGNETFPDVPFYESTTGFNVQSGKVTTTSQIPLNAITTPKKLSYCAIADDLGDLCILMVGQIIWMNKLRAITIKSEISNLNQ